MSEALWAPRTERLSDQSPAIEAYFRYYTDQSAQALCDQGRHATARTHQDIVDVAEWVHQDMDRAEILHYLHEHLVNRKASPDKKAIEGTVNLTARLVLMIEVGRLGYSFTGGTTVDWKVGSLKECIERHFEAPSTSNANLKLEKLFNAQNLILIAGLEVIWTSNLADHLRLTDDDQKLSIFHHVTFLKQHAR